MGSELLTSMGMGGLDLGFVILILTILLIAAIVVIVINTITIKQLTDKYARFMKGRNAKSLENEIFKMFEENAEMKMNISKNTKDIRSIYKQLEGCYQKMGLTKYDAYEQLGGKLSFCLCMLEENNNGFLINSVYNTSSSYTYIKRIENGQCRMELSQAEAVTLEKALKGDSREAD